jgi:hypothetical protein
VPAVAGRAIIVACVATKNSPLRQALLRQEL